MRQHGDQAAQLTTDVRKELELAVGLVPLLCVHLRRTWDPQVYRSDSSEYGFGVCRRIVLIDVVGRGGRLLEKRRYDKVNSSQARTHALAQLHSRDQPVHVSPDLHCRSWPRVLFGTSEENEFSGCASVPVCVESTGDGVARTSGNALNINGGTFGENVGAASVGAKSVEMKEEDSDSSSEDFAEIPMAESDSDKWDTVFAKPW